jgi:lambda family phage tail tape measure protein
MSEERIVVAIEGKGHVEETTALNAIKAAAEGAHQAISTLNAALKGGGAIKEVSAAASGAATAVTAVTKATKEDLVWVRGWGAEWKAQTKAVVASNAGAAKEVASEWDIAQKEILRGVAERMRAENTVRKQMKALTASELEAEIALETEKATKILQLVKDEITAHKEAGREILAADKARISVQDEINQAYADREAVRQAQINSAFNSRSAQSVSGSTGAVFSAASSASRTLDAENAGEFAVAEQARRAEILATQKTFANMFRERDALGRKQAAQDLAWIRGWGAEWRLQIREVERARITAAREASTQERASNRAAVKAAQPTKIPSTATSAVFGLGATLGTAFLGVSALKELTEITDAYQSLSNRVRLVTQTDRERIAVETELFNISNRARVSLDATSQIYQRIATSAGGLNLTQSNVLRITETISTAAIVGGSVGVEAEKGILQLTQGFSRGVLRGDELRSVLEQLPGVADVLAEHFKVNRGELYRLGEQGKLTSVELIKAFQEAEREINDKFGKTIPTIGQAFTVFRNKFVEFIGGVQSSTGIFGGIAKGIIELADSLEEVGKVLVTAAIYKGIQLIQSAIIALYATSGLGLAKVIFAGLLAANLDVKTVSDAVGGLRTAIDTLYTSATKAKDVVVNVFTFLAGAALVTGINALAIALDTGGLVGALVKVKSVLEGIQGLAIIQILLAGATNPIVLGLAAITGAAAVAYQNREALIQAGVTKLGGGAYYGHAGANRAKALLPTSYTGVGSDSTDQLTEKGALDSIIYGRAASGGAKGGNRRTFSDILSETKDALVVLQNYGRERAVLGGILKAEHSLKRQLNEDEEKSLRLVLEQIAAQKVKNTALDLDKAGRRFQQTVALRGSALAAQQAVFSARDSAGIEDGDPLGEALSRKAKGISLRQSYETLFQSTTDSLNSKSPGNAATRAENIDAINKALEQNAISADQARKALNELEKQALATDLSFRSGLSQGFLDIDNKLLDVASSARNIVVDSFGKATDAILEFTKTGKLNVTSFVTDILSQLARLAIEQNITGPLFKALSGALPSLFGTSSTPGTTLSPVPDATINNPGISTSGLNLNNQVAQRQAPQQQATIQVNHYNYAPGTKTETKQSKGPQGQDVIEFITSAVTAKQSEDANYGGGNAPQLRQYGLRRTGVHR